MTVAPHRGTQRRGEATHNSTHGQPRTATTAFRAGRSGADVGQGEWVRLQHGPTPLRKQCRGAVRGCVALQATVVAAPVSMKVAEAGATRNQKAGSLAHGVVYCSAWCGEGSRDRR